MPRKRALAGIGVGSVKRLPYSKFCIFYKFIYDIKRSKLKISEVRMPLALPRQTLKTLLRARLMRARGI